ncbi:MAG: fatty acid desaturase [Solirubrobacteraceae bacterium]
MNHARYRQFILASVLIPPLALVVAVLVFWPHLMTSEDAIVFAVMCVISGTGITVGFHRLLTHRSFRTHRPVRLAFAVFGTLAAEGPVIIWVAHHRHHHAMPDQPGDPHSPHMFGTGARAALKGLWHAHMGWLLDDSLSSQPLRYAPDLAREPEMRWISKHFLAIVIAGILFAGVLDAVISGSPAGLVRGIVWGGLVRIAFVNHTTYSVNSICHYFGRRRFATDDDSRNVAWLAPFTFGEAWHNNHHAFPTSARHGLRWYELDPSALVIRGLELTGLAWDVVRVPESRLATKTIAGENR